MSDPRYTDQRRTDPMRRFDLQGSSSSGTMWTWVAAIIAVIVVLGLVIGYSRTDQATNQSNQPATTTGSAPATSRPAPPAKSGDMPAPAPAAPTPTTPTPPAPAPNR